MAEAGAAISSCLSLAAKLLPVVDELAEDLSSSSSDQPNKAAEIKEDLKRLMRVLEQIKPHLSDAEERLFVDRSDRSIRIWLTELGQVVYEAEDVLDGYYYEVLRRQAETEGAASSCKRKRTQILYLDCDQIRIIISHFEQICKDMVSLRLKRHKDERGPKDPTNHFEGWKRIFGLERDKEVLIDFLLSECHADSVVSVVTVVGCGGLGKTTLAQLAYHEPGLRQRFHKFGWICVSDDFNVERLTREALKSITNQDCDLYNLSALQERLCKEIRGKKLLLVLDDVYNEDLRLWESFLTPFISAKLVKIVITTRNELVAELVPAEFCLHMEHSSENELWSLFQNYAFSINDNVERKLVEIGRDIIRKCGNLPLAVKLVASLLRHKADEKTWREVLESELWGEDYFRGPLYPSLMISYQHLPAYLKPCFLFCSMFPEDYEFNVEELSQLWVAQGYIKLREGTFMKTGQEYLKQLWQRSFFDCQFKASDFKNRKPELHDNIIDFADQFKGSDFKNRKLKLHDIIREFAVHIQTAADSSLGDIHLYVRSNNMRLVEPLTSCYVRTLIVGNNVENFLTASDVLKLQSLRVLELKSQCCDSGFLSSIGKLKHLRYLSLGSFSFQRLPESIGLLYNLQNLALTECTDLEELPDGIRNLVNLQVLRISCCLRFQRLPECIGNFGNLEKLVLDKCDIRELPAGLCQLYALQELLITGCRNLKKLPENIGRLLALETLVIEATRVRYLPHSLNNVKGLKKLILTFKKREQ